MKNFLIGLAALVVVGGSFFYFHKSSPQSDPTLGFSGLKDYNPALFRNGVYSNQYNGIGSISASSSSTTIASITLQLGSSSNGQLTIGTVTPATALVNASTTAITQNSLVFVQPTATTTIPTVTCNAVPPTSTTVSVIFASSTNTSLNGFQLRAGSIPTTNPNCYNYWIINKDK